MKECTGTRGVLRDTPDLGEHTPQRDENALGSNRRRLFQAAMPKKRRSVFGRRLDFVIFEEPDAHSSNLPEGRVLEPWKDCSRKLTSKETEIFAYPSSSRILPEISNFNSNAASQHGTQNIGIDDPIKEKTLIMSEQMNSSDWGPKSLKSTPSPPGTVVHGNATSSFATRQRMPLKLSARIAQPLTFTGDRPGLPTGKENVCPLTHYVLQSNSNGPSYASKSRQSARAIAIPQDLQKASRKPMNREFDVKKDTSNDIILPYDQSLHASSKPAGRTASQRHDCQSSSVMSEGRRLNESWLANQEISITATLNRLFSNPREQRPANGSLHLIRELETLFKQPKLVQLQQRLEASLRFGSLALPKGDNPAARLQSDIAIRGQFIDLWIGVYKHNVLSAAIEAIAGHGRTARYSPSSVKSQSCASIETFLLNHEGAGKSQESKGASLATSSWQRTMGRGLMLILLLDRARQAGIIDEPIFNRDSRFKSSWAVLLELNSLLKPSWSNFRRTLTHLEYRLDHTQHPLAEFDYAVRNLAVDLRDGVRLTRLIEVLFGETVVGSIRDALGQAQEPSIGDVKHTTSPSTSSHKLRYPLGGKAAKLHNVQIALNVMTEFNCISALPTDITAIDIVEGHRERTMLLLWFLLYEKAPCSLIHRSDLIDEIIRLGSELSQNPDDDSTKVPLLSKDQNESNLLELWAVSVARKHGLNAGTAAENIMESDLINKLINEYWFYIFPDQKLRPQSLHLEDKLNRLGFSRTCGK